jgi:hypothetical protein
MTRAIPKTRQAAAPLGDFSPAYGNGRGNEVAEALSDVIERDAASEDAVAAATRAASTEAYAARTAGNRARAAELFAEVAAAYRSAGFRHKADMFDGFAADQRTPPKTIGRGRGKR